MSTCRYFLQGTCRYGDRCRFAHDRPVVQQQHYRPRVPHQPNRPRAPIDPRYSYVAHSTNHRQPAASNGHPSVNQPILKWINENFHDKEKVLHIVEQMRTEAKAWLASSLWRFTSRSLFPGGQPLEHWADFSFEEVRWAYHTARTEHNDHKHKEYYSNYWVQTERQLLAIAKLDLDTFISLKPYIDQYAASSYQPANSLATDVEMTDGNSVPAFSFISPMTHIPVAQHLSAEEQAVLDDDTFELGQIPLHAPSQQFP